MKLEYHLLIISISLIFGFGLAFVLRVDLLGLVDGIFGKKFVDVINIDNYGCRVGNISRFSSGFPFSAYKDCSYRRFGTYCTRHGCDTINYSNTSVIFNGFFGVFYPI